MFAWSRAVCVLLLPLVASAGLTLPGVVTGEGGLANALCETNPTHLACNTTVAAGHMVISQLPAMFTIRPCSIFLASPHCCAQFCLPGSGGTCDAGTGACFCAPTGVPSVCQALVKSDDTPPAGLSSNDGAVLDICRDRCTANPNGCTKAAAVTDGIVGTVCMCYC